MLVQSYLFPIILNIILIKYARAKYNITILHMNDIHARIEETNVHSGKCSDIEELNNDCYGGIARLTTAIRTQKNKAESKGRDVLILNAGDSFQGTIYYNVFKSEIIYKMLENLQLDAMCLGNHEFDDGPLNLAKFINNVTFPVLACNIDVSKEPSLKTSKLQKSKIIDVNGLKIGIVGYVTPDTKITSKPGNVDFLPEIANVQEEVDNLRSNGAKIVFALGHSGFNMDKEIAKSVNGIELVVGGHTNTFLYNGIPPSKETPQGPYPTMVTSYTDENKKVPVVQAYAYTKYLGVLNIDFDDNGNIIQAYGNPVLLDNSVEEDQNVINLIKPWKKKVDDLAKKEVGYTKVFLDGTENMKRESNLANFITDAFIDFYVSKHLNESYFTQHWTDAPISIVQTGGVRASIDSSSSHGVITYADVATSLPFMDRLYRVVIKGKDLRSALEWSVHYYTGGGTLDGTFLQVSGLKVEYDISKPCGQRVVRLKARCGNCTVPNSFDVEDEKNYGILMSHYLAEGGDGFTMFKNKRVQFEEYDELDIDIVINYIKKRSPIYPALEGRIIVHNANSHKENGDNSSGIKVMSLTLIELILMNTVLIYISL